MKPITIIAVIVITVSHVFSADYYVDAARSNDSGDGSGWLTAKQTIQAAVDLTVDGDTVRVADGTYDIGSVMAPEHGGEFGEISTPSRLYIINNITVRSVNGPEVTIIKGAPGSNGSNDVDSVRGVCMTDGLLVGFTITNGYAGYGGGACFYYGDYDPVGGGMISNCVLIGNFAGESGGGAFCGGGGTLNGCIIEGNTAQRGGGVCCVVGGEMNRCTIRGNSASVDGGGAFLGDGGWMKNCQILSNSCSGDGGGVYVGFAGPLENCLIADNQAGGTGGGIFLYGGYIYNCCIYRNTASGPGSWGVYLYSGHGMHNCILESSTLFRDGVTVSHTFSLTGVTNGVDGCITSGSTIDAGNNAYAPSGVDLNGNPRIIGVTVDMGAYESYSDSDDYDADGIPNGWENSHYGNITDAVAEEICANGINNVLEAYIAGLDPKDPTSEFKLSMLSENVLQWPCVSGRVYSVCWSTNLLDDFQPLETNISWTCNSFTYSTDAPNAYFRIDAQLEE